MAKTQLFMTPDGRIVRGTLGGNRRSFVGGNAILGGTAILGGDGGGAELAAQIAQARAAGGYVAEDKQQLDVAFYFMLPFSVDVPAGATVNIQLQPQRDFRCDNLVVSSPEGPYFELNKWNVGQDNMFVSEGSVNCSVFSEAAAQRGLGLRGYTANAGIIINLGVTNTDADNAHRFSGMLTGPALIGIG